MRYRKYRRIVAGVACACLSAVIGSLIAHGINEHARVSGVGELLLYAGVGVAIAAGSFWNLQGGWRARTSTMGWIVGGVMFALLLLPSESIPRALRNSVSIQRARVSRAINYVSIGGVGGAILSIALSRGLRSEI